MWNDLKPFSEIYNREKNLFNFIRFILAIMVIYAHSFPLIGDQRPDIMAKLTQNAESAGSIAVLCFFTLSGFLTTQSLEHSKNHIDYLKKRLLRIVPAFLVSLCAVAFILGPKFTGLPLKQYFSEPSIWKYIFYNITFNLGGKYQPTPADLFTLNIPYPGAANGSSWTLTIELGCYVFLILLSVFYFIRYRSLLLLLTMFIGFLHILNVKTGFIPMHIPVKYFWFLGDYQLPHFLNFGFFYLMGCLAYLYRDKILYSHRFLLLAYMMFFVLGKLNYSWLGTMLFIPYIIFGTGLAFSFKKFEVVGDTSYGLYIYAFPIQQTLVLMYGKHLNVYYLFIISTAITFIFAFISWRYIEKPILKLKKLTLHNRSIKKPKPTTA